MLSDTKFLTLTSGIFSGEKLLVIMEDYVSEFGYTGTEQDQRRTMNKALQRSKVKYVENVRLTELVGATEWEEGDESYKILNPINALSKSRKKGRATTALMTPVRLATFLTRRSEKKGSVTILALFTILKIVNRGGGLVSAQDDKTRKMDEEEVAKEETKVCVCSFRFPSHSFILSHSHSSTLVNKEDATPTSAYLSAETVLYYPT